MVIYSEFDTLSMDVAVDFVGYEDCKSLQDFGPAIRDNYVLHYISSGSGYFHYKKEKIFLKKGDLFLLPTTRQIRMSLGLTIGLA